MFKFKIGFLIFCFLFFVKTYAQKEKKQEFGVNAAGLLVKNQSVIAPSFIYRYKINNYQLRFQFAFDARETDEERNGFLTQKQTTFSTQRDTNFKYGPTKNNAVGFILGYQYNSRISKSNFCYFYGVDLIYMLRESIKKGDGTALLTQSQSTITQNTLLKSEVNSKSKTYGIGIPMGITYYWDSNFFISLEAKFVMAYQSIKNKVYNESVFTQQNTTNALISGSNTTTYGFDVGLKPLTGLCFGIKF